MIGKPFRPPLLKKVGESKTLVPKEDGEPEAKRRRISPDQEHNEKSTQPHLVFKSPGISSLPRKPLLEVKNSTIAVNTNRSSDHGVEGYYNVLW